MGEIENKRAKMKWITRELSRKICARNELRFQAMEIGRDIDQLRLTYNQLDEEVFLATHGVTKIEAKRV